MRSVVVEPAKYRRNFILQVIIPLGITLIGAALLAVVCVGELARNSDEISIERQSVTLRNALTGQVQQLSDEQRAGMQMGVLARQMSDGATNSEQFAVPAQWFVETFGHDQVLLVDGDGAVIASVSRAGEEAALIGASTLSQLVGLAGQGSSAVHQYADIVAVGGSPAAVSIAQLDSDGAASSFAVNVDRLDAAELEQLSTSRLIDQISFSNEMPAPSQDLKERYVAYSNAQGNIVGYFSWVAELPGFTVLSYMAPISLGVLGLLVIVLGWLARSLWRSGSQLNTTMIQLKASEAQAQHLAFHDALTGLANRALFNDRFDQALARVSRGEPVAILALDIDRFKHINDTLGHHAGDFLLRDFSSRVSGLLRANDTMARTGGDEFAILLSDPGENLDQICSRILEAVRQPFDVLGSQTSIGVSIGVALSPQHGTDRIELLRKADIALYEAKAAGRNCYRHFTDALDETARLRKDLEDGLKKALRSGGELFLAYQPQVSGDGESIVGLEALARWQHPTRGVLMPNHFIPIAEEAGLMGELGEWVVAEACRTARKWPALFMAINVSPRQLEVPGFVQRITAIVRDSGCKPEQIELEVTEGVLLADGELSRSSLAALRDEGFRIALDDFGTGYSSLAYLQQFKVDKIKIDRSFTQSIDKGEGAATIIASVVALGHAMGLKVTAEGVENQAQRRFLSAVGCNELQGFLFSKGVSADRIAELMEQAELVEKRLRA